MGTKLKDGNRFHKLESGNSTWCDASEWLGKLNGCKKIVTKETCRKNCSSFAPSRIRNLVRLCMDWLLDKDLFVWRSALL